MSKDAHRLRTQSKKKKSVKSAKSAQSVDFSIVFKISAICVICGLIMISALKEIHSISLKEIDQAVFLCNAS